MPPTHQASPSHRHDSNWGTPELPTNPQSPKTRSTRATKAPTHMGRRRFSAGKANPIPASSYCRTQQRWWRPSTGPPSPCLGSACCGEGPQRPAVGPREVRFSGLRRECVRAWWWWLVAEPSRLKSAQSDGRRKPRRPEPQWRQLAVRPFPWGAHRATKA